uniref:N-acetyltransferase ESCO2 n=1 Tax=Cyanistes caeruleus TaxID=156563 RepID=A0A8C0VH02_CYACU
MRERPGNGAGIPTGEIPKIPKSWEFRPGGSQPHPPPGHSRDSLGIPALPDGIIPGIPGIPDDSQPGTENSRGRTAIRNSGMGSPKSGNSGSASSHNSQLPVGAFYGKRIYLDPLQRKRLRELLGDGSGPEKPGNSGNPSRNSGRNSGNPGRNSSGNRSSKSKPNPKARREIPKGKSSGNAGNSRSSEAGSSQNSRISQNSQISRHSERFRVLSAGVRPPLRLPLGSAFFLSRKRSRKNPGNSSGKSLGDSGAASRDPSEKAGKAEKAGEESAGRIPEVFSGFFPITPFFPQLSPILSRIFLLFPLSPFLFQLLPGFLFSPDFSHFSLFPPSFSPAFPHFFPLFPRFSPSFPDFFPASPFSRDFPGVSPGFSQFFPPSHSQSFPFFPFFPRPLQELPAPLSPSGKAPRRSKESSRHSRDQMIIDAGQRSLSPERCGSCGMLFSPALPEDRLQHLRHHRSLRGNLGFSRQGWKQERVVAEFWDGKIVLILPGDPKHVLRKVPALPREFPWEPAGSDPQIPVEPNPQIPNPRALQGCLEATPITQAFRVLPEPFPDSRDTGGDSDSGSPRWAWRCRRDPEPAVCGISRIWVLPARRRRGIARRMLDTLRWEIRE